LTDLLNIQPTVYKLKNGTNVTIRPICPDDAEREQNFIRALSPQSRYSRFMSGVNELTPKQLHYFTHNKPPEHVALIATHNKNGDEVQIGVARYVLSDIDNFAEFAVVVADEWQGEGIASLLLKNLAEYAISVDIKQVKGFIFRNNSNMYALAKELGLKIEKYTEDPKLYEVSGYLH